MKQDLVPARSRAAKLAKDLQVGSSRAAAGHANAYLIRVNGTGTGGATYSIRGGNNFKNSQFRHGGVGGGTAQIDVLGGFPNAQQASHKLADMLADRSVRNPPLAGGFTGVVNGRTVTIDDYGILDFSVLRQRGK